MPSELRLIIARKEARLMLSSDDGVVEDEVWKFDAPVASSEARNLMRIAFDECYDLLQYAVHGD